MLTSSVVLLHDNARPHTAARTQALLQKFRWDLFDHTPYSPDLAPSDFHLFSQMKVWLGTQRLRVKTNQELMDGVKDLLSSQPATFYHAGIVKLVSRYDKCLNSEGDYSSTLSLTSMLDRTAQSIYIQGGPKVGIQYIVYKLLYTYFWPTLYIIIIITTTASQMDQKGRSIQEEAMCNNM